MIGALAPATMGTSGASAAQAVPAAAKPWTSTSTQVPAPRTLAATDYWTPERMTAAVPANNADTVPAPPSSLPDQAPAQPALSVAPVAPRKAPESNPANEGPDNSAARLAGVNASILVGKVFFHNVGKDRDASMPAKGRAETSCPSPRP
ncbi:hypothetical protein ACGF13_26940 [Kitasatospora sp. NPDC048286]|uniref:hypothetical protein n=1 Tax=unclassified Kitasatospora TaxID=2633591 RepID=UPI0037235235